jgi:transcriptional regulator with XRE-family HTH domain
MTHTLNPRELGTEDSAPLATATLARSGSGVPPLGRSASPKTLTDALTAASMTRARLARMMHLTRPTISGWEKGRRRPARHYWPSLGKALGLTLAEVAVLFADHPPARGDGTPLPSLAFARRRSGMTQRALARSIGVAPTTLAMWETAGVRVPLGIIDEIAHVLEVDVPRLVSEPPSRAPADPRPLRRLRKSRGMSQREAATHLGIAVATLARYESGDRLLPIKLARRMAALYRCPTAVVLSHGGRSLPPLPPGRVWRADQVPEGIRAARLSVGMTKVELGRALGRSAQAVHKWERGETRPTTATCRRLEAVLGLSSGQVPR